MICKKCGFEFTFPDYKPRMKSVTKLSYGKRYQVQRKTDVLEAACPNCFAILKNEGKQE